jgi:catechol 1,2-dioxygenase
MITLARPLATTPPQAPHLKPTSEDIVGPFYRPNAAEGDALCSDQEPGEKLLLNGKVLDQWGRAIPGAKVDVWQADREGNYDINDPKDALNPKFPYKFRAVQNAGPEGDFAFSTIRPGHYSIGENKWRTGHIHVKVSAEGYKPLTTQLYFEGDEHNDTDGWFDPARVVSEAPLPGGYTSARYDIVLARK